MVQRRKATREHADANADADAAVVSALQLTRQRVLGVGAHDGAARLDQGQVLLLRALVVRRNAARDSGFEPRVQAGGVHLRDARDVAVG